MSNVASNERPTSSTFGNLSKIIGEQGMTALWRGNAPNIYRHLGLLCLQVTVYDRIKHAYMPYDSSKYSGIDFYWRVFASSSMILGLTAALTYPFDLIHTRLASDMSKKGQQRLYTTVFDCFNRTNIDEGFRKGLYKGIEIQVAASVIRSLLTLPTYDAFKNISMGDNFAGNFYSKIGVSLFSSLVMSLIVYPLDTAKRCLQLNGARGHFNQYTGTMDCIS